MEQKKILFIHDNIKELSNLSSLIQLHSTLYKNISVLECVDTLVSTMKKRSCNIFINEFKNKLTVGRLFEDELLDIIEYEIIEKSGFVRAGPELGAKSLIFCSGLSERERNFWTDFFYQKSSHVNVDAILYVFVLTRNENEFILSLCHLSTLEKAGPYYRLKILNEKYCGNDLFKMALGSQKPKKIKNIALNEQKTRLGKVYVNKQDFKALNLKKGIFKKKDREVL